MTERSTSLCIRAVLAALAFAFALASSCYVFHRVPTGADENSYVFQAHNFAEGRIARPAPPLGDYFRQEMIILDSSAGWLSRYPPGHPLWLTPGVWLNDVHLMIALAAAVAVWFACAAATAMGLSQVAVGLLLLLSPFFFFMYGTQLSHTSGLAAVAVMLWGYVRGQQGQRRYFAVAGLAWGLFFLNRTYSALLIALPFGLDAAWRWLCSRRRARFLDAFVFAGAASVGVLAFLAYNRLAVGESLTATYLFYEPSEGLGFGPRRTQGELLHHTLANGLAYLRNNVRDMNRWLFGFPGSLVAAAALALVGWSRRWSLLLLGATLSVWLGYVYFWYPGVTEAGGPAYFFETLVPLVLLVAFGLQRLGRALAARPRLRAAGAVGALALLAVTSAGFALEQGRLRAGTQQHKRQVQDLLRNVPRHALVLIQHLDRPHVGEMALNARGLESDPLLMRSMHEDNAVAQRVFSDRRAFLFDRHQSDQLIPLSAPTGALRIGRSTQGSARRVGRDEEETARPHVVRRTARSGRDAEGWLVIGKRVYLPAGRFRVEFRGDMRDVEPTRPVLFDVVARNGRTTLARADAAGARTGTACRLDIEITNRAEKVEARAWFGGAGEVALEEILYEEIGR